MWVSVTANFTFKWSLWLASLFQRSRQSRLLVASPKRSRVESRFWRLSTDSKRSNVSDKGNCVLSCLNSSQKSTIQLSVFVPPEKKGNAAFCTKKTIFLSLTLFRTHKQFIIRGNYSSNKDVNRFITLSSRINHFFSGDGWKSTSSSCAFCVNFN